MDYSDNQLIINYHDACIYGRDLKLLEDETAWLNDACLHYQLICFQQQQQEQQNNLRLYLDPSVVFCLVHQLDDPEEYIQFAKGYPQFHKCRMIFLPINDTLLDINATTTKHTIPYNHHDALGTHWSLLIILQQQQQQQQQQHPITSNDTVTFQYLHFDSMKSSNNIVAAQIVAEKWNQLWKYTGATTTTTSSSSFTNSINVQNIPTPQQRNGYDCGIHLLMTIQYFVELDDTLLLSLLSLSSSSSFVSFLQKEYYPSLETALQNNPHLCQEYRNRIAKDIRHRAKRFVNK